MSFKVTSAWSDCEEQKPSERGENWKALRGGHSSAEAIQTSKLATLLRRRIAPAPANIWSQNAQCVTYGGLCECVFAVVQTGWNWLDKGTGNII